MIRIIIREHNNQNISTKIGRILIGLNKHTYTWLIKKTGMKHIAAALDLDTTWLSQPIKVTSFKKPIEKYNKQASQYCIDENTHNCTKIDLIMPDKCVDSANIIRDRIDIKPNIGYNWIIYADVGNQYHLAIAPIDNFLEWGRKHSMMVPEKNDHVIIAGEIKLIGNKYWVNINSSTAMRNNYTGFYTFVHQFEDSQESETELYFLLQTCLAIYIFQKLLNSNHIFIDPHLMRFLLDTRNYDITGLLHDHYNDEELNGIRICPNTWPKIQHKCKKYITFRTHKCPEK